MYNFVIFEGFTFFVNCPFSQVHEDVISFMYQYLYNNKYRVDEQLVSKSMTIDSPQAVILYGYLDFGLGTQ